MRPIDALIQQFNTNDLPYYIMVDSKYFCPVSNIKSKDKDKGAQKLLEFLRTLPTTSVANYRIYCYENPPEVKSMDAKTLTQHLHDYQALLSFCPFYETDERREEKEANKYFYNQRQEQLAAELAEIKAMLKADRESDEDLEEEAQPTNALAGLINNPKIQEMLIGMISGMASKFMSGGSAPQAMAGIPATAEESETKLLTAIERLYAVDPNLPDDLHKLADMAEKETAQFNWLLSMLRK